MSPYLKVVWYRQEDDLSWKKCWRTDSERLESLHCLLRGGASGENASKLHSEPCLLENTRLSANVMERTVLDTYMEHSKPRTLRRGTWFYNYDDKPTPLPEDVATHMEAWFDKVVCKVHGKTQEPASGSPIPTAAGEYGDIQEEGTAIVINGHAPASASASVNQWGVLDSCPGLAGKEVVVTATLVKTDAPRARRARSRAMEVDGFHLSLSVSGLIIPAQYTLVRGHREYTDADMRLEKLSQGECGHLLIYVHGIGEQLWSQKNKFLPPWQNSVEEARNCFLERRFALKKQRHERREQEEREKGGGKRNSSTDSPGPSGTSATSEGGADNSANITTETSTKLPGAAMGFDAALDLLGFGKSSPTFTPAPNNNGSTSTGSSAGIARSSGGGTVLVADRVECLPVMWHESIHTKELATRMRNITLPNLLEFRGFANEALLDILLFMAPDSKCNMLNVLTERINTVYRDYCANNADFVASGGKCSLVGHSLGTVLLFELLSRQQEEAGTRVKMLPDGAAWQLGFNPHSFFAMGSPIGMFLNIGALLPSDLRNEALKADAAAREAAGFSPDEAEAAAGRTTIPRSYRLPSCPHVYNIIHQHDVISYRIEPLLDVALAELEPALVPRHDSDDGLTIKSRFQKGMNDFNSAVDETVDNTVQLFTNMGSHVTRFFGVSESAQSDEGSCNGKSGRRGDKRHESQSNCGAPAAPPSPDAETLTVDNSGTRLDALLNNRRRIDYRLQTHDLFENRYLEMLPAHGSYMASMDVASFIYARLDVEMGP